MSQPWSLDLARHFDRGNAVGKANIRTDSVEFVFRDEVFEFSTREAFGELKIANEGVMLGEE